MDEKEFTYKKAGVDIEAGAKAVELMKAAVKSTFRPEVLTEIGGFGGLFAFDGEKYKEPVLVSAADGVGTKLKIAQLMDRHEMVGIDLVAMCADDVVVAGAEPLFFLDYIAIGKVVPEKVAKIVGGIAEGCRMAGCALIGGEVAEHPGVMPPDEYDLAGFAVGVVERAKIIDGSSIGEGDVVLGLASSGLHSNGYSLVRKLIDKFKLSLSDKPAGLVRSLGEELLIPTKVYTKSILKLLGRHEVHGLAHITGGGLIENIPRILPRNADAAIDLSSWSPPPIFEFLRKLG
ncbi:MAG TPA: phosphoribosylformylglycinamidine cyclo-ligase, partial [Actinobacteria bacterium]|nr:phosphoribosylformylglycinamidine cyclo-ligase [Actinomycetota bacterium]